MPSITDRTVEVAYSGGGVSDEVVVGGGGSDVGGDGAPVVGGVGGVVDRVWQSTANSAVVVASMKMVGGGRR